MAQIGRPGLSAAQKRELWQRWKAGQSLTDIGRTFGKHSSSIHLIVSSNGGFLPRLRTRRSTSLTLFEREEISRGIAHGRALRAIAASLERAPSTISREVAHSGGPSSYRAASADERAWRRARRPQRCLLARSARLRWAVARKLALDWSPEQISGWLAWAYPDDKAMRVSTETIYRSLFIQARGVLKKELQTHLRSRRTMRRAKGATGRGHGKGDIVDAVSIRERPAEAADRAVPGHWEGDLVSGTNNSHVATLVERRSRFLMLVKVPGKDTQSVVGALRRRVRTLPKELLVTLTWDRGKELADHKRFTVATDVKVYFCDPSSPWQRGTNENTNGLLRQYLPKGTDLSRASQRELNAIARRLNTRPRKTLGYRTPAAILERDVALTG
jgi:IS30 family transposase